MNKLPTRLMKTGIPRIASPSYLPKTKIYFSHIPKKSLAMVCYPVNHFQDFDATLILNFNPGCLDFYYLL